MSAVDAAKPRPSLAPRAIVCVGLSAAWFTVFIRARWVLATFPGNRPGWLAAPYWDLAMLAGLVVAGYLACRLMPRRMRVPLAAVAIALIAGLLVLDVANISTLIA